eukprot:4915884-Pleurochrysis_carterae.AAC.5
MAVKPFHESPASLLTRGRGLGQAHGAATLAVHLCTEERGQQRRQALAPHPWRADAGDGGAGGAIRRVRAFQLGKLSLSWIG